MYCLTRRVRGVDVAKVSDEYGGEGGGATRALARTRKVFDENNCGLVGYD